MTSEALCRGGEVYHYGAHTLLIGCALPGSHTCRNMLAPRKLAMRRSTGETSSGEAVQPTRDGNAHDGVVVHVWGDTNMSKGPMRRGVKSANGYQDSRHRITMEEQDTQRRLRFTRRVCPHDRLTATR